MSETILAKLRNEHREIKQLLYQVRPEMSAIQKVNTFHEIKLILIPHMAGEERTLYARLREETDDEAAEEIASEANQEHHEIREYIQRLNLMEPEDDEWLKEFLSFKEHVEQHFLEEETELFDEAKEDFSVEELVELAYDFEEAKHHPLP